MEAYFGDLANFKVFGKRKEAEVLTFKAFLPLVPLTTAFLAAVALAGKRKLLVKKKRSST